MMFLFVFPTRSSRSSARSATRRQAVDVSKAQNEVLTREEHQLRTKSQIERLAREQFNMVLPGEQAYNVMPGRPRAAWPPPRRRCRPHDHDGALTESLS